MAKEAMRIHNVFLLNLIVKNLHVGDIALLIVAKMISRNKNTEHSMFLLLHGRDLQSVFPAGKIREGMIQHTLSLFSFTLVFQWPVLSWWMKESKSNYSAVILFNRKKNSLPLETYCLWVWSVYYKTKGFEIRPRFHILDEWPLPCNLAFQSLHSLGE